MEAWSFPLKIRFSYCLGGRGGRYFQTCPIALELPVGSPRGLTNRQGLPRPNIVSSQASTEH